MLQSHRRKHLYVCNKRIGSYNIVTGKNSIINSNDLNRYLFADECESCKNKTKRLDYKDFAKNEDLGVYEPPHIIRSCDSFQSVESDGDTDSDIESDEEVVHINKNKIDTSML